MKHATLRSTATRRRVFGRESPVLDYWLAHSEGFKLVTPAGRGRGDVEGVVIDDLGRPHTLVARSSVLRRPQLLDVRAVEAVDPSSRTIRVRDDRRTLARPSTPAVAPAARRTAAAAGRVTVRGAPLVWIAVTIVIRTAWAVLALVARGAHAGARRSGRAIAAALRWTRPHARTLARRGAAAAVTAILFLGALTRALVLGIVASARLIAQEWRRQRAGPRRAGKRAGAKLQPGSRSVSGAARR